MTYNFEIHKKCKENIQKICKKNPILEKALKNKIKEIIENPQHYKPLKSDLSGERRVHIMKSFVLKFEIDENCLLIRFTFFGHHDEAYKI